MIILPFAPLFITYEIDYVFSDIIIASLDARCKLNFWLILRWLCVMHEFQSEYMKVIFKNAISVM